MYRINEVIPILGLSKSKVYMLINSGRLRTVKEGRVRLALQGRPLPSTWRCLKQRRLDDAEPDPELIKESTRRRKSVPTARARSFPTGTATPLTHG